MFKRLLVLVLFVTGVFWWLTNRNSEEVVTRNAPLSVENLNEVISNNSDITSSEAEVLDSSDNVIESEATVSENEEGLTDSESESSEDDVSVSAEATASKSSVVNEATPVVPATTTVRQIETTPVTTTTRVQPVVVAPVRPPAPATPAPQRVYTPPVTPSPAVEPTPEPVEATDTEMNAEAEVEIEAAPQVEPAPVKQYADRSIQVRAYLYEWGLDFSSKRIEAGNVTFSVINSGQFPHEFNIRGVGELGTVPAKGRAQFTAYLKPGTYEVYSDRRNDYERGILDMIRVIE